MWDPDGAGEEFSRGFGCALVGGDRGFTGADETCLIGVFSWFCGGFCGGAFVSRLALRATGLVSRTWAWWLQM